MRMPQENFNKENEEVWIPEDAKKSKRYKNAAGKRRKSQDAGERNGSYAFDRIACDRKVVVAYDRPV